MENKKITVKEFVKKYNDFNSEIAKENYLKSIIRRKYCPILEKKVFLELMVNSSIKTGANGVKYIDVFVAKVNYVLTIITLYTNLTFNNNKEKKPDPYGSYDLLKKNGLLESILKEIDPEELNELAEVFGTVKGNFEFQYKTMDAAIASQINHVLKAFTDAFSSEAKGIQEMLRDKESIQKMVIEAANNNQ